MKAVNDYHAEAAENGKSVDIYFGIVWALVFFILALLPLLKGGGIRVWFIYASIILLILSFLFSKTLIPFRKLWSKFGLLTQKIMQPLILGIVFYGLFTPIGVVMRCLGKDPLLLKKTAGAASYWKLRALQQADTDMKNQF